MEHMAHEIGMDPLEFRLRNMISESVREVNILPSIIDTLKASSEYENRSKAVELFNANNRWKKRGLSLVPMLYKQSAFGAQFHFQLSIYQGDGTISVCCGAVEMGQGINTKVVQTVAKELEVPLEIISLKPVNVMASPNNSPTWGSYTTDAMCSSAVVACKIMKDRLQEVADTMSNPSWLELIQECYKRGVDLSVHHM